MPPKIVPIKLMIVIKSFKPAMYKNMGEKDTKNQANFLLNFKSKVSSDCVFKLSTMKDVKIARSPTILPTISIDLVLELLSPEMVS